MLEVGGVISAGRALITAPEIVPHIWSCDTVFVHGYELLVCWWTSRKRLRRLLGDLYAVLCRDKKNIVYVNVCAAECLVNVINHIKFDAFAGVERCWKGDFFSVGFIKLHHRNKEWHLVLLEAFRNMWWGWKPTFEWILCDCNNILPNGLHYCMCKCVHTLQLIIYASLHIFQPGWQKLFVLIYARCRQILTKLTHGQVSVNRFCSRKKRGKFE